MVLTKVSLNKKGILSKSAYQNIKQRRYVHFLVESFD